MFEHTSRLTFCKAFLILQRCKWPQSVVQYICNLHDLQVRSIYIVYWVLSIFKCIFSYDSVFSFGKLSFEVLNASIFSVTKRYWKIKANINFVSYSGYQKWIKYYRLVRFYNFSGRETIIATAKTDLQEITVKRIGTSVGQTLAIMEEVALIRLLILIVLVLLDFEVKFYFGLQNIFPDFITW